MRPYFALRSYQDGGEHYDGQVGSEATPAAFVDALLEVTRECVRVLKPSGSLWVNLGDKYVADNRGSGIDVKRGEAKHAPRGPAGYITGGMRQKSLMGIPWRYALACIDQLGLILRAEVIWSKPNGLPESVTDRVRRSHEQWFHMVLNPRYYSAVDEIREPHAGEYLSSGVRNPRHRYGGLMPAEMQGRTSNSVGPGDVGEFNRRGDWVPAVNPLGKLPGSVWTISTEPLQVPDHVGVDHFAAFPTEWPRRIITGWSPREVCAGCGEGRRPATDRDRQPTQAVHNGHGFMSPNHGGRDSLPHRTTVTITGTVCGCTPYTDHPGTESRRSPGEHPSSAWSNPGGGLANNPRNGPWREYHHDQWTPPPTTAGVVLDPFGGTGTTALVANALGRTGITVDLSADYCRLARWRTRDPDQQAKVLGFRRSDQARDADTLPMDTLFDLDGAPA